MSKKDPHRGVATSFWMAEKWKALLQDRAAAMGINVSDYIKTTIMYSLIQELGMGAVNDDGKAEIAAMTPERLQAFWQRMRGFRAVPGKATDTKMLVVVDSAANSAIHTDVLKICPAPYFAPFQSAAAQRRHSDESE